MNEETIFCWFNGKLFVGDTGTINGLQPVVDWSLDAAAQITINGGREISKETAMQLGWDLH